MRSSRKSTGLESLDWDVIERELGSLASSVDKRRLERWSAEVARGHLTTTRNRLDASPEPATSRDVDALADFSESERRHFAERGREVIERGEVAVCVLNGGMATRFGGVVKGVVEAIGGRSFLEIKLAQALGRGPVPFLIMNSFATQQATAEFLAERGLAERASLFLQSASLRLLPGGELFRDREGRLSPYAPGHGDFPKALRESGLLERLRDSGVRAITLSNVDNLGADLDPVVIGYHFEHGRELTCELAPTLAGDVGGAPARVGARMQIIEGFRFPEDWEFERNAYMATNSFVFAPALLEREYELTSFYVEKQVDGRSAVQIETLVNELSAHVDTAFLVAPRDPDLGRFFPVKSREDLAALRADRRIASRIQGSL